MSKETTQQVIEDYYACFNRKVYEAILPLIADRIKHSFNYENEEIGADKFKAAIISNMKHYDEQIGSYDLMISDDGRSVVTKFLLKGKYIVTDTSLIPASGQKYELEVFNYFEIDNGKIICGKAFFDEDSWRKQVASK
jgi:steroid delta-isomerase-like uncharacterized protein